MLKEIDTDTALLVTDAAQGPRTHALRSPVHMSNLVPDLSSNMPDLTLILAPVSGKTGSGISSGSP